MIYLAWGSVIFIAALFLACTIAASVSSARETREADGTDTGAEEGARDFWY